MFGGFTDLKQQYSMNENKNLILWFEHGDGSNNNKNRSVCWDDLFVMLMLVTMIRLGSLVQTI